MSKKGSKKSDADDQEVAGAAPAPAAPFNNPFANALKAHPILEAKSGEAEPAKSAATKRVPGPARAVVRLERKGHGGKEVTVVEQLGLSERDLERWLKALKGSLGCGGSLDGGNLVLQGDHRERLKALLEARGVKKVSVG